MFNLLSPAGDLLDASAPVLLWITVAVLVLIIIAGVVVFFAARKGFKQYIKYALFSFLIYSLVAGIYMLVLTIIKYYGAGGKYEGENQVFYIFLPICISLLLILSFAITAFAGAKSKSRALKIVKITEASAAALSVVVTLVLIAVFFKNNIKGDGYYDTYLNNAALYVSAAVIVAAAIVSAFLAERKDKSGFDSRALAYAGISVATSFAMSYIKIFELPQGGSITLASMLPIMLFSYAYGAKKGLLVGVVYGMLQAVQDPYVIHPAQFLLDYPVAFGLVGMTGILRNVRFCEKLPQVKFAISATIGATLRFVSHVLSGVFAFGAYAAEANMPALPYSLAYNSFVFADLAIVILVGVILFSSKAFNAEIKKINPVSTASEISVTDTAEEEKQ